MFDASEFSTTSPASPQCFTSTVAAVEVNLQPFDDSDTETVRGGLHVKY